METRELICINCPLGCSLTVTMENGAVKKVEGNTCKKGEDIWNERSDQSHKDRDLLCPCDRRHTSRSVCQDSFRYSKRKDL